VLFPQVRDSSADKGLQFFGENGYLAIIFASSDFLGQIENTVLK